MRLVSFEVGGEPRFGAVDGDCIRDLTGHGGHATLESVLRAGAASELKGAPDRGRHAIDSIRFLPPVAGGRAIFCVGVNYAERNEEYGDRASAPAYPSLFLRMPESFTGHETPLERPLVSEQFDYEGEIVVVIGKAGRHIPRQSAFSHIAGLTLANEGSVRDWLRHAKFNVTQGKNFDRSGSIGPWIVTADELDPASPLHLTTRVNGELRQDDTTARLMFPFDYLIAYFSTFATLKPGDLILTGTPTGAGARFNPPKWLVAGDVVEITVPEIGTLRNVVADEHPMAVAA